MKHIQQQQPIVRVTTTITNQTHTQQQQEQEQNSKGNYSKWLKDIYTAIVHTYIHILPYRWETSS